VITTKKKKKKKKKKKNQDKGVPPIHLNAIVNHFNGFTSDGSIGARLDWHTPAFTVPW